MSVRELDVYEATMSIYNLSSYILREFSSVTVRQHQGVMCEESTIFGITNDTYYGKFTEYMHAPQ